MQADIEQKSSEAKLIAARVDCRTRESFHLVFGTSLHINCGLLSNSLQPDFAPPGINTSWAEHSAIAVTRLAPYPLQNDGRGFHCRHFSRLLVYKVRHPGPDSINATTIRNQFSVEKHASILQSIDRLQNLLVRFDSNSFAGLQLY